MEVLKYLQVLQRRKGIIILVALITFALVAVKAFRTPPTYTAIAKLRVAPLGVNSPDYGTYIYFDRLANTYSEIIKGVPVLDEVAAKLGVKTVPTFRIDTIPQTELMRLSVDSNDPKLAQDAANTLADSLVTRNQALYKAGGVQDILQARLAASQSQLDRLTQERSQLLGQIPRDEERIANLDRMIDAEQQNYSVTLSSYNQALISQSALANALSVVEPASLPADATGPARIRDSLLGAAIGLVGGIALAFVLEGIDPRLYSNKQVSTVAQSTIIAQIPFIGRNNRKDIFKRDLLAAEAFRRLRATIFASNRRESQYGVLLVTSSISGEGKSMTAANLALSFALAQQNVVLVDCDLHRPSVHQLFNLKNTVGLSSVLEQQTALEAALQPSSTPKLSVLTSGPIAVDASELFSSTQMTTLLDQLLNHFEIVVLDGPPTLSAADTSILAPQSTAVILVVDPRKVNQKVVAETSRELHEVGARLIGVVINRVRRNSNAFRHSYYVRNQKRLA